MKVTSCRFYIFEGFIIVKLQLILHILWGFTMTGSERKFFDFIQKNIIFIFLGAVTVCGTLLRAFGIDFQSDDFNSFLNPWWSQIQYGGINGLAKQVGNYNIPYQIITYILTLLPFSALHSYKLLSIIFDFVLAVSAAMLVYSFSKKYVKIKAAVAYALTFCSITVILNSSFWAQCDSIYVAFILLSIYFLEKEKNIASFIFVGIAFAFKLQTVFILPFYIFYYISTQKISILHFLIIPITDVVMCLPAVLLGRPVKDIIEIYLVQTDYGKLIQMNCPNFYALICNGNDMTYYYLLKSFSIILTLTILGSVLCFAIYKKIDMTDKENILLTAIWTVFTCIMFLSSMHERYGYLIDILAIIYAMLNTKRIWLAIVCNLISLRGYCYYLFNYDILDIKLTAILYAAVYFYVTYIFVKEVIINKSLKSLK